MALSNTLLSQFAKATANKTQTPKETTVYGTTVMYNGKQYVRLDGSDLLTPVNTTITSKDGDRVTVMIKNHTATITGNSSDPSASGNTVTEMGSQITEFEIVMAYKVTTQDLEAVNATIESLSAVVANIENADILNADIENLKAKYADLEYVDAETMAAINADIENLEAKFAEIDDLTAEELEALNAEITNLRGYNADFTYVSADMLSAFRAEIKELEVNKLSAKEAEIKYAQIDFANIGEAAIEKLFSDSGIIKDLVMDGGYVTGELVGVTIKGDLIEANTLKADKLVILGEDGLYYKLNFDGGTFAEGEVVPTDSLHGSVITANSITAEKVNVSDLVAFDATIAGMRMTEGSIYSGVKSSVDNSTEGFYMDKEGQLALGDMNQYLRYYKDADGVYRLEIVADSISIKSQKVEDLVKDSLDGLEIGARNLIRNSTNMIYEDYYFGNQDADDIRYLVDESGSMLLDEDGNVLIE